MFLLEVVAGLDDQVDELPGGKVFVNGLLFDALLHLDFTLPEHLLELSLDLFACHLSHLDQLWSF